MANEIALSLTEDEAKAVYGWAGMAGVGFSYGGSLDPNDPGVTALNKLKTALGIAEE